MSRCEDLQKASKKALICLDPKIVGDKSVIKDSGLRRLKLIHLVHADAFCLVKLFALTGRCFKPREHWRYSSKAPSDKVNLCEPCSLFFFLPETTSSFFPE